MRLFRTFTGPRGSPVGRAGARGGAAFDMTSDQFAALFPVGHQLHVQYTAVGDVYEMSVGLGDLVNARTLRLPAVGYAATNVWTIALPADTPYGADFPEATHALVSSPETFPGESVYFYYQFDPQALRYRGFVVAPDDGSPTETHVTSLVTLAFPANADTYLYEERPEALNGVDGVVWEEAGMHAFGTFEPDDATSFTMGAFFFDHFWTDPDDPDGGSYGFSDYSILGADGSLVLFQIAPNPTGGETEIEGDVYIENIEYVQVVPPTAAERGPEAGPSWSVYPNPAADVVRFSETLDVALFDVLGREVRSGARVRSLDVTALPAGLYVARTPSGESRPLVIR